MVIKNAPISPERALYPNIGHRPMTTERVYMATSCHRPMTTARVSITTTWHCTMTTKSGITEHSSEGALYINIGRSPIYTEKYASVTY